MIGVGREGPVGPPRRQASEEAAAFIPEPAADSAPPDVGRGHAAAGPHLLERDALAVIAATRGVGPVTLERLLAAFGGAAAVLEAARRSSGPATLIAATRDPDGPGREMTEAAADALAVSSRRPSQILDAMRAAGVVTLGLDDPEYPERLKLIEWPPRVLFVRGSAVALDPAAGVAIVGTRRPTDGGRRTAARIGAALARAGAAVVSGLAVGIDGSAHAAVVAQGGRTIAVIGGGHDRLFPPSHDRLADAIVDGGGAIVSEYAPGTPPTHGTFPRRNRIISGLADAVVVIEAGARSGALLTASWALEQGRECFFVPGAIDAPQSAGCLAWLRDYAGVARIVSGVPQLLEDLGLVAAAAFPATPARAALVPPGLAIREPSAQAVRFELSPREERVAIGLASGAATVDELVSVTQMTVPTVLASLTALETAGLATGSYGRYRPAGALAIEEHGTLPGGRSSRHRETSEPAA